jgi:hypothetical protein
MTLAEQIIREARNVRTKLEANKLRIEEMLIDIADIESHLHNWVKVMPPADAERTEAIIERLRSARRAINGIGWGSNIALPIERVQKTIP